MARKRRTTEDFVNDSRKVHGDKYDYSKTVFEGVYKKVIITCPKHGDFEQIPKNHLMGFGCYACGRESVSDKLSSNNDDFIREARNVHGEKYGYELVNYVNSQTKVKIICPIHGVFEQTPNNHLYGYGCKKCADETSQLKNRHDTMWFVSEAKKVHGDKYDYTDTVYETLSKKVKIRCPVHGVFEQYPQNHLKGWGCSKCSQSHLEREVCGVLDESHVLYVKEKTFDWLINEKNLYLDFYLPEKNMAIECQGEQHYRVVDFSGKNPERAVLYHTKTLERDEAKRKLCEQHGIKVLYYTHCNQDLLSGDEVKTIDELKKMVTG